MKVTTVTVRASRTLPHPEHQFANFRADVELSATLEEGDTPEAATRSLQAQAETMVEQHCSDLKTSIREFARIQTTRERAARLEQTVKEQQAELEQLRAQTDSALPLFARGAK